MIKLNKVNKLGEPDNKFGQKFWAETDEIPVMFSSHQAFNDGDTITYEDSENRTSGKGTKYLLLKKVKKLQGSVEKPNDVFLGGEGKKPQALNDIDPLTEILDLARENNRILKKLAGEDE